MRILPYLIFLWDDKLCIWLNLTYSIFTKIHMNLILLITSIIYYKITQNGDLFSTLFKL